MRKPTILVPTRSDKNRAVQSQKMVRGLKVWILKVEALYYLCSENKGLAVTVKLICAFVFAYADCLFSLSVAHTILYLKGTILYLKGQLEHKGQIRCLISCFA